VSLFYRFWVGFVSVSYSIFQSSSTVSETNTHIYNRHRFSRRRQKKTKRKLIFKSFSTFNIINQYLLSDFTQIDNSNKLKQFPSYEILRLLKCLTWWANNIRISYKPGEMNCSNFKWTNEHLDTVHHQVFH